MADQQRVDATTAAYDVMRPRWDMVSTLMGGTEAMRAAGEMYLPRYPAEVKELYDMRLAKATLLNYFERTVKELTSKVFAKDVQDDAQPAWFEAFKEDVDRQGNNLTVFAQQVFETGLAKGIAIVLVDHTKLASGSTLQDEREQNAGPYLVHIQPENLIAAYAEMVNGKEQFTHVRIREAETVRDGFSEYVIERIRVWEPGSYALYEKDPKTDRYEKIEEGLTSPLTFVPLCIWYSGLREDVAVCKPPLMDLAHLNVTHWQSASDQRHCLTVSRFPMLAGSGIPQEDAERIVVGPNSILVTPDSAGRYYYVEPNGAAIEAGRKDLEDLQNQMAMVAIDLQVRRPGNQTATGQAISEAKAISIIESLANTFSDFLELVVDYVARWRGEDGSPGSIRLNSDIGVDLSDAKDLDVLFKSRQAGEISRDAYLAELQRRGVLGQDFDAEVDADLLESEGPNLSPTVPDPFAAMAPEQPVAVMDASE